jgi:hypothetical protein
LTLRFMRVNVATVADFLPRNAPFGSRALLAQAYPPSLAPEEEFAMQWTNDGEKWRAWLVDYSAERARAIESLGDRYLLARPINRRPANGRGDARPWIRNERASERR